jgi:hypothetical protein
VRYGYSASHYSGLSLFLCDSRRNRGLHSFGYTGWTHVRRGWRSLGFFVLGTWHGLLQLLVSFLLIWFGNGWAFLSALVVIGIFAATGIQGTRRKTDVLIRKGVSTVALASLRCNHVGHSHRVSQRNTRPDKSDGDLDRHNPASFVLAGTIGMAFAKLWTSARIRTAAIAGAIGALVAGGVLLDGPQVGHLVAGGASGCGDELCLAGLVFCGLLVFDGHAMKPVRLPVLRHTNQFIRFRVTEDTLTGFVDWDRLSTWRQKIRMIAQWLDSQTTFDRRVLP